LESSTAPADRRACSKTDWDRSLLKILTLNLHKGFSSFHRKFVLHELRDAIREISADVVFLQEVLGDHREHSRRQKRWPDVAQYEFLADTIWQSYAYGRNAVYPAGHHGNALLSKFPILHYENEDVSIPGSERRGLLHTRLRLPDWAAELHAICVHLGLRETHRKQQVAMLGELVNTKIPAAAPVIVAGDFNDWRGRAHAPLLEEAGLQEVFIEAQGRAARTFPVRFPLLRLDRIYVRRMRIGAAAILSRGHWSQLSDHAALAVELEPAL
jgi:endonuclease/exonuclease/phosphatase family metal-dependent hydrolase